MPKRKNIKKSNEERGPKHLELAYKWFEFHANQRFSAFYFYLVIIGALSWGYITCINNGKGLIGITPFLSIFAFIVSYIFLHLEIRNVELVNIGREALRGEKFVPALIDYVKDPKDNCSQCKYKVLTEALKYPLCLQLKFFVRESFLLHEFCFRSIYLSTMLASFISLVYSLYVLKDKIKIGNMSFVVNGKPEILQYLILGVIAAFFLWVSFFIIFIFSFHWKRKAFVEPYEEFKKVT